MGLGGVGLESQGLRSLSREDAWGLRFRPGFGVYCLGFRFRVQGSRIRALCLGFRAVKDSGLSITRNGAFVRHVHFKHAFECGDVISRTRLSVGM